VKRHLRDDHNESAKAPKNISANYTISSTPLASYEMISERSINTEYKVMKLISRMKKTEEVHRGWATWWSFRLQARFIICWLRSGSQALSLTLLRWLKVVVVALTTAVIEWLAKTQWTHIGIAHHVVGTGPRFFCCLRAGVYIAKNGGGSLVD